MFANTLPYFHDHSDHADDVSELDEEAPELEEGWDEFLE